MTLSWNQNASHTQENLITIELCDWIWECSDGPGEISTSILFTNIYRNTYLQKYVVASPGHGHSGVGPEQAADHLVHHPAGDCRWYWWRCELVVVVVIMVVMKNAWKTLKKTFCTISPNHLTRWRWNARSSTPRTIRSFGWSSTLWTGVDRYHNQYKWSQWTKTKTINFVDVNPRLYVW